MINLNRVHAEFIHRHNRVVSARVTMGEDEKTVHIDAVYSCLHENSQVAVRWSGKLVGNWLRLTTEDSKLNILTIRLHRVEVDDSLRSH